MTTDHPDPRFFLIDYIPSTGSPGPHLEFTRTDSLHERGARPTEFFTGAIVDPSGEVAIISSYVGKLKVLELNDAKIVSDFDVS